MFEELFYFFWDNMMDLMYNLMVSTISYSFLLGVVGGGWGVGGG